jgi:hypothetical protein
VVKGRAQRAEDVAGIAAKILRDGSHELELVQAVHAVRVGLNDTNAWIICKEPLIPAS